MKAGKGGKGELRIIIDEQSAIACKSASLSLPDTNDFILEVTAPDGSVVYSGPYGSSPERIIVPEGNCVVSIRSVEFWNPAFDSPQFGDDRCVMVPSGGSVNVNLVCTQLNCGIRLRTDADFLTAYPDGVLFVRSSEGELMYSFTERRVAYFLPGNVSVVLKDDSGESVVMTRELSAREILSVNLGVSSNPGSGGIGVQVDTTRIWNEEDFTIGQEQGGKGTSADNALSVSAARSSVGSKDVWVTGYIVGGDLTSSASGISFSPPFKSATNLAIASRASVSEKASCLAVQLPSGDVRNALNLVSNPSLVGRRVSLKGDIDAAYFGLVGLKNVSEFVLH